MPNIIDINPSDSENFFSSLREELEFFLSPQLQQDILIWKIIFIAVSLLFIVLLLLIIRKDEYDFFHAVAMTDIHDRRSYKDLGAKKAQKRWDKIKIRLNKESDAHWKLSLIEAEDFLDSVLQRMGYGGDNLDERLERLKEGDISNLIDLKKAHKVCSDIVRDPDYKINKIQAVEEISIFEKSLMDLNAL